jgi:hypothetical protein
VQGFSSNLPHTHYWLIFSVTLAMNIYSWFNKAFNFLYMPKQHEPIMTCVTDDNGYKEKGQKDKQWSTTHYTE